MCTSVGQGIQSGSDYAWQEFFDGLCQAVASTASLQSRLATLALGVLNLRQDNFPEPDDWSRFQMLMRATSGNAAKPSAAKILAATAKMSEKEAAQWLHEAVHIFSGLSAEEEL